MRLVLTDGQSKAALGEFSGASLNECARKAARKYKGMIARLDRHAWFLHEEHQPNNRIPISSVFNG